MSAPNDRLTQRYHDASSNKIREIEQQLSSVSEEDLPKLPESLFRAAFLPFFAGELPPAATPEMLQKWFSIAGNPFWEVIIFEDTTKKILFRVPPIFDRSTVTPDVENRTSLGHIMRSAEQYAAISPIAGQNFMLDRIEDFTLTQNEAAHRAEYFTRWNDILTRYGKPKLVVKTPPAAVGKGAVDGEDEEFFF